MFLLKKILIFFLLSVSFHTIYACESQPQSGTQGDIFQPFGNQNEFRRYLLKSLDRSWQHISQVCSECMPAEILSQLEDTFRNFLISANHSDMLLIGNLENILNTRNAIFIAHPKGIAKDATGPTFVAGTYDNDVSYLAFILYPRCSFFLPNWIFTAFLIRAQIYHALNCSSCLKLLYLVFGGAPNSESGISKEDMNHVFSNDFTTFLHLKPKVALASQEYSHYLSAIHTKFQKRWQTFANSCNQKPKLKQEYNLLCSDIHKTKPSEFAISDDLCAAYTSARLKSGDITWVTIIHNGDSAEREKAKTRLLSILDLFGDLRFEFLITKPQ